jgi:CheY-like chemotaxis protein
LARVLIVDDDRSLRFAVAVILKQEGYQTVEAENGLDALRVLKQDAGFDLILSDVQMSQMNGIRLLEELRKDYPHIPVVMLSVYKEWRVETAAKGEVSYLPKPFSRQQLVAAVQSIDRTVGSAEDAREPA